MQSKHSAGFYFPLLLTTILLLILPVAARASIKNVTAPVDAQQSIRFGEYLASIKHWEGPLKFWLIMYQLYLGNPDRIEWLERNVDENANFAYILALLEYENDLNTNRSRIFDYNNSECIKYNDKTIHFLRMAARQEHAAALYNFATNYFCEGDISQSFEYYSRSFYSGYYGVLSHKALFDTFSQSHPQQIAEMERYAKKLNKGTFDQFYSLMSFYYYRRDKETSQYFYKLAEKNAQDSDKYRLVYFYNRLGRKVLCNEKEIDAYRQSMLAGNMRALETFTWHCKMEGVAQKTLTEGLQHIEKKVNTRIKSWQEGNIADFSTLFTHIGTVRRLAEFYEKRYSQKNPSLEDLKKANYYYQHLIELGNTSIFNDLGDMWLRNISPIHEKSDSTGSYLKTYCQKAHDYFVQGSQHNNPRSIEKLAIFYLNNKCIAKDEAQSMYYQEKLATLADTSVDAVYYLCSLADTLYDMEYFSQAKIYSQQIADYGEIMAMQLLARLWLIDQDGLEIDEQKAQFWYEKTFEIMQNDLYPLGNQYLEASMDFRKAGFNEIADTYLQRAIELLGDEKVQEILQSK